MNKKVIKNFKPYVSFFDVSVGKIIKKLNQKSLKLKFQIVINKNYQVLGTVTDGDIRRGILKDFSLSSEIREIMNNNFTVGNNDDNIENNNKLEKLNLTEKAPFLPIVDKNNILKNILIIHDSSLYNTAVLIMAGGFGKRLGSYTEKKPKPLVEVAGKPILQYVLDKVLASRAESIHISVYYKHEIISNFLKKQEYKYKKNINIIREKKPLGTIGALGLIENKVNDSYLIINADIITDVPLDEIIFYHNDNNNDITIGAAIYEFEIPYGVIKYDKIGKFHGIMEKPNIKNLVSAGIYVLSNEASLLIPHNKYMDMPEFIELAKKSGFKIGVFPVHEYWKDIGLPETLIEANQKFKKKN